VKQNHPRAHNHDAAPLALANSSNGKRLDRAPKRAAATDPRQYLAETTFPIGRKKWRSRPSSPNIDFGRAMRYKVASR
jgi:hypothetical protein